MLGKHTHKSIWLLSTEPYLQSPKPIFYFIMIVVTICVHVRTYHTYVLVAGSFLPRGFRGELNCSYKESDALGGVCGARRTQEGVL